MAKPKTIYCPNCGRKVGTYDGRSTSNISVKCKKCNKLVVYNVENKKAEIKEIPQREYLLMEEHEELSLDRVDMLEKAYQYVQEKMQEVGARELYSLQMK